MISPLTQIENWIQEAEKAGEIEATAAALATTKANHQPSVRFVLTKGFHEGRLAFVTNYESPKAHDLNSIPYAELCFYWKTLFKQARIAGRVERAPANFSDTYWRSRPRESQLGAWASNQSAPIESYESLESKLSEISQKYIDLEVPRPPHWGAYFLIPERVELWLGQKFRIHQRYLFTREGDYWKKEILAP